MCAIAGISHFKKDVFEDEIKAMIDFVSHRGPDGEGV